MSDRPMRLKYLTKMKISLCIFLLFITAVSVFGQSVELNGVKNKSIEFPAAVKMVGSLKHIDVTIGDVTGGRFTRAKYSDRLQWDSSTGYFSLSGLKLEDSGEYKVQNTDQNINTLFQLNVYIPVSKPNVIIHYASCTIECTAERGTGVTLSWYREGEEKPYVSSRVASAPHLHLPVPVERSGTYTCEAKNSVSNEKASITVGVHCTVSRSTGSSREEIVATFIAAVLIVVLFAVLFYLLYRPPAGPSTGTIVLAAFLIVALIADLICFLCFSPASPSTGTVVLVSFLIVALIAVLICFCIKRKILDSRTKHLIIDGITKGLQRNCTFDPKKQTISTPESRGLSEGKNELGIEEGDPTHLRDDLP